MARKRLTRAQMQDRTRTRLLEAADKLFARHGFAATSLEQIASEAGVTKGAVYSNFESKEDLFLAMLRDTPVNFADMSVFNDDSLTLEERFVEFSRRFAHANPSTPAKVASELEWRAFALRNARVRAAVAGKLGGSLMELGAILDEVSRTIALPIRTSGTKFAVIVSAVLQGLVELRATVPDLVTDDVFAEAGRLLSRLVNVPDAVFTMPPDTLTADTLKKARKSRRPDR